MSDYSPPFVSLLGGGQLGKMLIREAMELDINMRVLDPDPQAPCRNLVQDFICGNFRDYETVIAFGNDASVIGIEIEDVNVDALKELKKRGVKIIPDPEVLEIIKDKGKQKNFYRKAGLPHPDFILVDKKSELLALPWPEEGFVQKLRTGGYDGKGVQVIKSFQAWLEQGWDAPSVIERCVSIKKEISVIVVRSGSDSLAYDPVEMVVHKEGNLLDYLLCPADINRELSSSATALAIQCAEAFDIEGILAVEMFLDNQNRLWINEVAPRSHNSGHGTIEASITSQFAQHARVLAGLPPGSTKLICPYAMLNILGPEGYSGSARYKGLKEVMQIPGVYVHLYGKKEMRPLRKMGHVTVLGSDLAKVLPLINKIKNLLA